MPNTSKIILPHGFKYDQNKTPSNEYLNMVPLIIGLESEGKIFRILSIFSMLPEG